MPRYYCDFCDAYLTHDSASVRKQHNTGFKHKSNVRNYYQQFLDNLPGAQPAGGTPGMMQGYPGGPFPPRFDASAGLRPLGPGMAGPPGGFRPPFGSAPPPWQPPPGMPPGGYRPPYGGPPPGQGMPPQGMPPQGFPPPMGAPPPGMPPGM